MSDASAVWQQPVSVLIDSGALWVPPQEKKRLLRLYGNQRFLDFDVEWKFNEKIGQPYPTCFQSMMYWMNTVSEEDDQEAQMQDQFDKLGYGNDISSRMMRDMFNMVQSCVRTRFGEKVWYE